MVNAREKGKIARSEWPAILARHNAGETLAGIAKSFGCTGPAIRYIVSRQAGRDEAAAAAQQTEPGAGMQLVPDRGPIAAVQKHGGISSGRAIDEQLRERVNSDIAAFLVAFDAAYDRDSAGNRQALLVATDRLMRAGARTRIALVEEDEFGVGGRRVQRHSSAPDNAMMNRRN